MARFVKAKELKHTYLKFELYFNKYVIFLGAKSVFDSRLTVRLAPSYGRNLGQLVVHFTKRPWPV